MEDNIHTTKNWVLGLIAVVPWVIGIVCIFKHLL